MRKVKISESHLSRKAIVYVRQSTEIQVKVNTASPIYQREQKTHALHLGWHPSMIEIVEDLGKSGCSTMNREGFLDISRRVEKGQIGAIFFHDFSRLSRNALDFQNLLQKCKIFNVLLFEDGRLVDPNDANDAFLAAIRMEVAQLENRERTKKMKDGLRARIQSGKAVSAPPIGYISVPDKKGVWTKHPDKKVRDILLLAFQKAVELPSAHAVSRYFYEKGLDVPTQRTRLLNDHEIVWKKPTMSYFMRLFRNANYTQDYYYYIRTADPRNGFHEHGAHKGRPKQRRGDGSKVVVVKDHHDSYIDRKTYQRLRDKIHKNQIGKFQPAGKGKNLLQGILYCGHCGKRMINCYNVKNTKRSYYASPIYLPPCEIRSRVFDAGQIDEAVSRALFKVMGEISVDQVVARYEKDSLDSTARQLETVSILRRMEKQAEEAGIAYLDVDSDNQLVKKELEIKWQERLLAVDRFKKSSKNSTDSAAPLTADQKGQLHYLCKNFEEAFRHHSIDMITRKQLLRCFVQKVVLTFQNEMISLKIHWKGPAASTTLLTIQTARYVNKYIIEQYHKGLNEEDIIRAMQSDGIGLPGQIYTKRNITRRIKAKGLQNCSERRRKEINRRIMAYNAEGLDQIAIAERLNTEGIKPLIKSKFTSKNVACILKNLKRSMGKGRIEGPKNWEVIKNFLDQGMTCTEIAGELNALGLRTETGLPYTYQRLFKKVKCKGYHMPDGNRGGLAKEIKLRLFEMHSGGKSYREAYEQLRYEGVIDSSPNTRNRIWVFFLNLGRKEPVKENIPKEFMAVIYDFAGKDLTAGQIANELNRLGIKPIKRDVFNACVVNNYCHAIGLPLGRKQYLDNPALKELVETSVASGNSCRGIAERLNKAGFSTHNGRPFNQNDIGQILHRQGLKASAHSRNDYIIREIRPLFEAGCHPRTIGRKLNSMGLKTVTGGKFKTRTVEHYLRIMKSLDA